MGTTEFHGPDGQSRSADMELEYFQPRSVRAQGTYQKAMVSIDDSGHNVIVTTRNERVSWRPGELQAFIEAAQEALEYLENHPQNRNKRWD